MSKVYIQSSTYLQLPARHEHKVPRSRYVQYYRDLMVHSAAQLDEVTFYQGDQYTYAELGDALFTGQDPAQVLQPTDVLIAAYWTPEFDPDYMATLSYFHDKYALSCQVFDVCDNGTLACMTAMHVGSAFLSNDDAVQTCTILGLEQTTIPRSLAAAMPIPAHSSSSCIRLTADPTGAAFEILATGMLHAADVLEGFDVKTWFEQLADTWALDPTKVCLVSARTGWFYKSMVAALAGTAAQPSWLYLPATPSVNHLPWMLQQLPSRPAGVVYLLVDEDAESLQHAWMLIR